MAEANDYIFTTDWFSGNIPVWNIVFESYKNKPNLKVLEVGSFQGRSTVWLLENVLTHATSEITCVDTFEGSVEHNDDLKKNLLDIFKHNVTKFADKVTVLKGPSQEVLRALQKEEEYDFIYIDGDHHAHSVLADAVLAFPLLKKGGIMIFDDYGWQVMEHDWQRPKLAIDAFVQVLHNKIHVIHVGYQVVIRKLSS
jgi:predicted O-methyltransferase YrrM